MASYVNSNGPPSHPSPVDALVGQRITAGAENITVLVIAQPAANVQEITAMAERAVEHLMRLKQDDRVMLLEHPQYPATFVPPEYPLNWVTNVAGRSGGTLTTVAKKDAHIINSGRRAPAANGCVRAIRRARARRSSHPPRAPPPDRKGPRLRVDTSLSVRARDARRFVRSIDRSKCRPPSALPPPP